MNILLNNDDDNSLEQSELNYKALLINVTKKRKDYPSNLAKHLGYSIRLEKNAIESMKVELPPRSPLDCDLKLPEDYGRSSFEKTQAPLDELVKAVQSQISQMSRLSEALEIVNNSQTNN